MVRGGGGGGTCQTVPSGCMAYAVWPRGCDGPPIEDAADIGEGGGRPECMLPGFHKLGDIFII